MTNGVSEGMGTVLVALLCHNLQLPAGPLIHPAYTPVLEQADNSVCDISFRVADQLLHAPGRYDSRTILIPSGAINPLCSVRQLGAFAAHGSCLKTRNPSVCEL
jgi:hypothetical protein